MSPDDSSHGGVVCRNVDVDSVSGEDADLPPSLHAASRPCPNLQSTLDLDDERRVAV